MSTFSGACEDWETVSDHVTAFKSAEDHQAFVDSAWAKGEREKVTERLGGAPNVRRFETPDFPDATHKALTQYSFIELSDASKNVEARQFWIDFVSAVGSESFGGRSVDDKAVIGLGLLGWDSIEVSSPCDMQSRNWG